MLTEERKQYILRQLELHQIIKVQDLIQTLDVSESTIRRDLQDMETDGLLERIHGGAKKVLKLDYEQDMQEKSTKNVQEKQRIAAYAASLIKSDEVIYLDAGTTTYYMIPHLAEKDILVVTNSAQHASYLADYHVPVIMLGGQLKISTKAVLGADCAAQLRQYRFNRAFMGMNAIHLNYGLTTPDSEEAAIKRIAIQQAEEAFILADHTKFGKITFAKVAELSSGAIITDTCPEDMLELLIQYTTIKEVDK